MIPLRDLQDAMRARILGGAAAALPAAIGDDAPGRDRRLEIHRNNSFAGLTEALKETYPVVCRLVDERFFRFAADAFIRRHPPTTPSLAEYGGAFAGFLEGFPPARSLAYLPDVARLEWALNTAFHAPDAPPLDPARLAAVPQDRYPNLVLTLHPACRLLESPFPIDRIWLANQSETEPDAFIDPAAGGCRLLIRRRDMAAAVFVPLDAAAFAFAAAIAAGTPLQGAYEAAAAIDPAFDLVTALRRHLGWQSFTGFASAAENDGGTV